MFRRRRVTWIVLLITLAVGMSAIFLYTLSGWKHNNMDGDAVFVHREENGIKEWGHGQA